MLIVLLSKKSNGIPDKFEFCMKQKMSRLYAGSSEYRRRRELIGMKHDDPLRPITDACKKGTPAGGVYLFCGEEEYLKRHYLGLLRKKLLGEPENALFDWVRLSGDNPAGGAPLPELLRDALESPPLMCPGKLVEIHSPGLASLSREELELWETLLSAVPRGGETAVVLLCGSDDFPMNYRWETTDLAKKASRFAAILPFCYQSKAKLSGWVSRHLASEGLSASSDVISFFIDRCGCSMDTLSGELQKLSHYLQSEGRSDIEKNDIAEICCPADEAEAFGISTAVIQRNISRLFSEFEILKQQKTEPMNLFFQISSALSDLARVKAARASGMTSAEAAKVLKLHPYKTKLLTEGAALYQSSELETLLESCLKTDLYLKQTSVNGYELVERLICQISL